MPRESKIQYNPRLSVAENAKKSGVTEDAIRYYIRTRGIDRRFEEKKKVLKGMKAYLKEHPNATRAELAKETGHGINTVRRYWDILHGEGKLKPSEKKADVREQRVTTINNRHIAYLDKLPVEFIREYLVARETAAKAVVDVILESTEVVEHTPIEVAEAIKQAPVEVVEQADKKAKTSKKAKEKAPKKEKAKAEKEPKTKKQKASKVNSTIRCTDEYVYFYQNTPLSNWWISEPSIPYDGHEFSNSEALFMYLKAKTFRDEELAKHFPHLNYDKAKDLGHLVRNFSDDIWEKERENAMYIALKAKLAVDKAYRETLLSEEFRGKTFVEASPSDEVWGIHQSITDAYNGAAWKGLNLLGKLHTIIRDELLSLREPQERVITPIEPIEIKPKRKPKATISKNIYSTDDTMIRSIIGGIIGDISGSTREGYGSNAASARLIITANSYFTDDSAMTIAVAEWLNNRETCNLKDCLIKWHDKYPNVGYGHLFNNFTETGEAQPSNANGGAMRVAPCAIYAQSLEEAMLLAEEQCKVSHTTDIAINGAKAIAAAIYIAKEETRKGKTDVEIKATIKSYIETHFGYNLDMPLEDIQERSIRLAFSRAVFDITKVATDDYKNNNMSSASLSCPMAIQAFLLGNNYEESIRYALAMGGDSDSIACMAGSVSAQVYGIPKQLVDEALVYLPSEMIDVLNRFETENNFTPTRISPPKMERWSQKCDMVVYGYGNGLNEKGTFDTYRSNSNAFPKKGYKIPTIGKSLDEIKESIAEFITYAKQNPDIRFHIKQVGYDKAGYTIEQIAPLFNDAKEVTNILFLKEMLAILNW